MGRGGAPARSGTGRVRQSHDDGISAPRHLSQVTTAHRVRLRVAGGGEGEDDVDELGGEDAALSVALSVCPLRVHPANQPHHLASLIVRNSATSYSHVYMERLRLKAN